MKKFLICLPLAITLLGCGEESKIRDLVRENLKDPDSAQFKDFIISNNDSVACITWNAKNSKGGYTHTSQ
jgi:hypothetical protein